MRSTLMALDDANRTGNYSVFRMLASPSFQAANSPDGLAEAFSVHRARALDLSVAALSPPEWSALPAIGQDGRLRLSGAYLLGGDLLRFALAYEASGGSWRLYEIRVGTEPQRATGRQASVR
ncbi:MAG: hypothetical protein R3D44_07090 [Hyphomicrobiaceae bacterium]